MRIGIVADDLTGAADAVAPFVRRGLRASVGFSIDAEGLQSLQGIDALALTTGTRDRTGIGDRLIAPATRWATRRLRTCAPTVLYKKIDSTLRGHLREELDGMRRELPSRLAVICPAFPATGRKVEQGILHVHGRAQQQVRVAFEATHDTTATELTLDLVRRGVEAVETTFARMEAEGIHTVFCDAVEQADLEILAQVILRQPQRYLPVGSAGLTAAIAAHMDVHPPTEPPPVWSETAFTTGRVLIVVGSQNPVSRRQAAFLMEHSGVRPVVWERVQNRGLIREILSQFDRGQRIVLFMTPETTILRGARDVLATFALDLLAQSIRLDSRLIEGLIATGGDTAMQFCGAFNGTGMQIVGEILPGIVTGHLRCHNYLSRLFEDLPTIIKAGGFGEEDTLARCVGLL